MYYPPNIYLFKVSNRNTSEKCKICSKLTIKTPKWHHWGSSGVFFCLLWTYFTPFPSISIVGFEQVNISWVILFSLVNYFPINFIRLYLIKKAPAKGFCLFWKHNFKNLIWWIKEETLGLYIMNMLVYSNYSRFPIQIYRKLSVTPRVTFMEAKKTTLNERIFLIKK